MTDFAARDRVLATVIAALGQMEDKRLILVGGTLLRTCAFEDYRYSEDLDFDWLGSPRSFMRLMRAARTAVESTSCGYNPAISFKDGTVIITHDGEDGRDANQLSVDCNDYTRRDRKSYDRPTTLWPLQARYELPPSTRIQGLALEAIAANKIACLSSRTAPRDLYDLYRLSEDDRVDMDKAWAIYLDVWERYRVDKPSGHGRHMMQRWRPDPHPAYTKGAITGSRNVMASKWADRMPAVIGAASNAAGASTPTFDDAFDSVMDLIVDKHAKYVAEYKRQHGHSPFADAKTYTQAIKSTTEKRVAFHKRRAAAARKSRAKEARRGKKAAPASGICGYDLGDNRLCRNRTSGGGRCHLHRR